MKNCLLITVLFFAGSLFAQGGKMDSLDQVIATSKDPAGVSAAHVFKAQMYFYQDTRVARQEVTKGLSIALKHQLPLSIANAYNCKGILHVIEGDFFQAHNSLDSAILIYEMLNDENGLSRAHGNKAVAFQQQHNYSGALDENLKSLTCYEKKGDLKGVALSQSNIGAVYHALKDHENALKYYRLALHTLIETKSNIINQISLYGNISTIYTLEEKQDSAILFAERMLVMADSVGMDELVADAILCFGRANFSLKKFDEGRAAYEKALVIFDAVQSPLRKMMTQAEYAAVLSDNGFYAHSVRQGEQVLDEVISGGHRRLEADLYRDLGTSYAGLKDFKKAFEYKDKYIAMEKELMAEDHLVKVAALDANFKMQRKEDQIKLLEEKNKNASLEIIAKDSEIDLNHASIRERNLLLLALVISLVLIAVFFMMFTRQRKLKEGKRIAELEHRALRVQMNPHFIFNSMNSIQRLYVEGKTEQASDYMADFANLMRKILDNSSKESITLEEEIKLLKMYLELENIRCAGMIEYDITIADDVNCFEELIPPMIIQPFVENAIWHGILPKNTRGYIEIRISRAPDKKLMIVVEDDGVGFTAKMNSGHEPKGMKITEQRLGHPVVIEARQTGGTRIILAV